MVLRAFEFFRLLSPRARALDDPKQAGRAGERAACAHLRRKGYRVAGRNVRVSVGEADIVCLTPDRRGVVIVEVKSRVRRPGQSGASAAISPERAVDEDKARKLREVTRRLRGVNAWKAVRIDTVAVEFIIDESGRVQTTIRHHENSVLLDP